MKSTAWQDDCACTPDMADLFTPDNKPAPYILNELAAVCSTCPVQRQCAQLGADATETGYYAGVWIPSHGINRMEARKALRRKAMV